MGTGGLGGLSSARQPQSPPPARFGMIPVTGSSSAPSANSVQPKATPSTSNPALDPQKPCRERRAAPCGSEQLTAAPARTAIAVNRLCRATPNLVLDRDPRSQSPRGGQT